MHPLEDLKRPSEFRLNITFFVMHEDSENNDSEIMQGSKRI